MHSTCPQLPRAVKTSSDQLTTLPGKTMALVMRQLKWDHSLPTLLAG